MPKSLILSLLKRVAPIDLPEILIEVEKGIFKSDLSKLQNEIQETDLNKDSDPIYISKQPENMYAKTGEPCSTTVFAKGYNLSYQWYYKDSGMTSFGKSSIKNPTYQVNRLENERIGRTVYCEITGTNLDGSGSYKIVSNQVTLNLIQE